MPDSIRLADDGARDLKDAALRAFDFGEIRRYQDHRLHDAFILGRLGVHPDCRLLDCHNSRLLLTRGDEALEVRSPLARESILLPFPPGVVQPQCLEACLLQGHDEAASSFRVVYLQHRRKGHSSRQARAVEYDSSRKSWQDHPWETLKSKIEGTPKGVMHAGHRMFCIYKGRTQAALMLDTRKMEFSVLPLPAHVNFAIGEIEDNACCFVESVGCANHRLKVWQLDEEKLDWELKKDIKMDQVLGDHVGYYCPRVVSNGIALVCSATTHHHFIVDLNTCSMKEKFEFHGQSAYAMQMPWPPAFSGRTANVMNPGSSEDGNNENQHELRDGPADGAWLSNEPRYPSNEPQYLDTQDPTTTASTPAAAELCFGKDKNYVPSDYLIPNLCSEFSDLMHPEVIGSHNPERRRSLIRLEQGATARCHPKYCIKDPEIPDDAQIGTSCCREASTVSTAGVSVGECKPLLGDSASTIKFSDAGKQPIIDFSITHAPSISDPSAGESTEQRCEASWDCVGGKLGRDVRLHREQDLDIQDPTATATALTPATAEQCFGKDKNYVPNDYLIPDLCGQFSDLVHPEAAGGFDQDGGPASVGNARTGSGESDAIEGLLGGTLAMAPPAAPAVELEEPLLHVWRSRSPFRVQSLNHDLLLQPPALARCPQQGRKRASSRESKGSPEAMGPERRNWKRKPKYLEAIFGLRRRHSFSDASKISDEVQIATSSCREASAASTAAVSAAECKPLFGGSSSTTNYTDSGKQPIIDVSITSAPSLFVSTRSTAAPEPTSKPTQEEGARPSRRPRKPNTKYIGEQWV